MLQGWNNDQKHLLQKLTNKIKLLIRIKLRAETEDKTVPREFHELKQ